MRGPLSVTVQYEWVYTSFGICLTFSYRLYRACELARANRSSSQTLTKLMKNKYKSQRLLRWGLMLQVYKQYISISKAKTLSLQTASLELDLVARKFYKLSLRGM